MCAQGTQAPPSAFNFAVCNSSIHKVKMQKCNEKLLSINIFSQEIKGITDVSLGIYIYYYLSIQDTHFQFCNDGLELLDMFQYNCMCMLLYVWLCLLLCSGESTNVLFCATFKFITCVFPCAQLSLFSSILLCLDALAWLNADSGTGRRRSCLPFHIRVLMNLFQLLHVIDTSKQWPKFLLNVLHINVLNSLNTFLLWNCMYFWYNT